MPGTARAASAVLGYVTAAFAFGESSPPDDGSWGTGAQASCDPLPARPTARTSQWGVRASRRRPPRRYRVLREVSDIPHRYLSSW